MIIIKTKEELKIMRKAGKILARALEYLKTRVKSGVTTMELNNMAENFIKNENARAAFKGYKGFPTALCTSVNDEVVHGIPDNRTLKDGDIISLDLGVEIDGFYADAAISVPVGKIDLKTQLLLNVTKASLLTGIEKAFEGNRLGDISYAIQNYVESFAFSVVKEFVGHGIGRGLHEDPQIPNFGKSSTGPLLKEGMVFAIEPMVNMGTDKVKTLRNGWTAVTEDSKYSAHFEHTVAITDNGPVILTSI